MSLLYWWKIVSVRDDTSFLQNFRLLCFTEKSENSRMNLRMLSQVRKITGHLNICENMTVDIFMVSE